MLIACTHSLMTDIYGLAIFRCLKERDNPEVLGIVDGTHIGDDFRSIEI